MSKKRSVMTERAYARDCVERLPQTIRIGLYDFTIEKWHADRAAGARRWGECSTCEFRIAIQLDMPTRVKAADTFMHEVHHAVFWAFGVQDEDKEERTILLMASGLMTVYRDNPWLLDWIKECVT